MSKTDASATQGLVKTGMGELVPSTPFVQEISRSLRIRPHLLIARIESALPAEAEQELYLTIFEAYEVSIHPESFAGLMRVYHGSGQHQGNPIIETSTAPHTRASTIDHLSDYIAGALGLVDRYKQGDRPSVSYAVAGKLILLFGADQAAELIEEAMAERDLVERALGCGRGTRANEMIYALAQRLIKHGDRGGVTPGSIWDVLRKQDHSESD